MHLLTSLESYWELDEASGTRVDSHGTNDLADNNTVTSATLTGSTTGADFESTNSEYLSLASNASLQSGDIQFTWAAWFKLESTPTSINPIFSKGFPGTAGGEYHLFYNSGNNSFAWDVNSTGQRKTFGGVLTPGTVVFIVVTHDSVGNTLGSSINGAALNTAAYTGGITAGAAEFNIGRLQGTANYFDGVIGPVGYWKRLLTDDEINQLYNSGTPLTYAALDAALAVATPTVDDSTDVAINITADAATGGTPPYTYQWKRATAANGSYSNIAGATALTLSDSTIVEDTQYWYKIEATDAVAGVASSRPVPAKSWPAPMVMGWVGDSLTTTGGINAFLPVMRRLSRQRQVTSGVNASFGGATTANWQPGLSAYDDAIVDFAAAGVTDVHVMLGSNDSTAGGFTPVTPATYGTRLSAIVSDLVSQGYRVWISYPPFYDVDLGPEHIQALSEYYAQIDSIVNGTTIMHSAKDIVLYYFPSHLDEFTDGEHFAASGEASIGQMWANGMDNSLNSVPQTIQLAILIQ